MKLSIPIILAVIACVAANQAPKNTDNVKGTIAVADFPKGNVVFYVKRGQQVKVHVDITALPESGGPFQYHIHENPVPANGDCNAVGNHFNPFSAPPVCDEQIDDSYCQVGDLSGKHGWIDTTCFETKYYDPYLSLEEGNPAYVVGKSVVFHYANLTKFACANIKLASSSRSIELFEQYREKGDFEFENFDINDEVDANELDFKLNSFRELEFENEKKIQQIQELPEEPEEDCDEPPKVQPNPSFNETYNGTDINSGALFSKSNATNDSSLYEFVSTDCENSGVVRVTSVFTAGLALIAGLFI